MGCDSSPARGHRSVVRQRRKNSSLNSWAAVELFLGMVWRLSFESKQALLTTKCLNPLARLWPVTWSKKTNRKTTVTFTSPLEAELNSLVFFVVTLVGALTNTLTDPKAAEPILLTSFPTTFGHQRNKATSQFEGFSELVTKSLFGRLLFFFLFGESQQQRPNETFLARSSLLLSGNNWERGKEAMDSATSPSSSPISVALHQESLRQRSPDNSTTRGKRNSGSTTRQQDFRALVGEDGSSDCSTSNPQQGTTTTSIHSASSELEGMRSIAEQPGSSRASRSSHRQGEASRTGQHGKPQQQQEMSARQKRPPRLIDTRPNMKIPPTHKDNRKLFVGGLPLDGTFSVLLLLLLLRLVWGQG
jgi:hypothetical protein